MKAIRPLTGPGLIWLCLIGALLAAPAARSQSFTETVLHNFGTPPRGANPYAGVIRDAAGTFYGTAQNGGAAGLGVVYSLDAAGTQTVLHSFTGGADGTSPTTGIIRDTAGNLYGTTQNGGTPGFGVVYKLDPAGKETVLYAFTGKADGGTPLAGLVLDPAGNLYGAARNGGSAGYGVIFKIDAAGKETVLYSFSGAGDGAYPASSLARDAAGNLYGTTVEGGIGTGSKGFGTVFKLNPSGQLTTLYQFTGKSDGANPASGVILDAAGNLYGTIAFGGGTPAAPGAGLVYALTPSGKQTVLYTFTGGADGAYPMAELVRDSAGNLYGTTDGGGPQSAGVLFKVSPTGLETVIYGFTFGDPGQYPQSALLRDTAGNLYGTTGYGGSGNIGVVFKVDTAGKETILYSFPNTTDGYLPLSGLNRDSAGNFYGTTFYGGPAGSGTLYKVSASGVENVVHAFGGYPGPDGGFPTGALAIDAEGDIYGTAGYDADFSGCVYEVTSDGKEVVLYRFTGGADGGNPRGGVYLGANGILYGTTYSGGASNAGVVFQLAPSGQETVLYNFPGGVLAGNPGAGVIGDAAGNLYGTLSGSSSLVYKISPSGQYSVLYRFAGGMTSYQLTIDSNGNLYGTANAGGGSGFGNVFKIAPSGVVTVLYSFKNGADGGIPQGGLALDAAGNIYGPAVSGGSANQGVVFEVTPAGQESVLYNFTGVAGGYNPAGGVTLDAAGNLYGVLSAQGKYQDGVIYELTPAEFSQTFLTSSPNPSAFGISIAFTVNVTVDVDTPIPTGTVILSDGGVELASGKLDATGKYVYTTSALSVGTHSIVATYSGDSTFAQSVSAAFRQVVTRQVPLLTWPAPAPIVYGTALSATQLDAKATNAAGVQLAGTYKYTPAAGTILPAGPQRLSVTFTPTDAADYATPAPVVVPLTVAKATPVLTWPTPAGIAYGTPLSGTQLNATVAGVTGAALPGALTYKPAAGAVLAPGTQELAVNFTPADAVDYDVVFGSVNLVVSGVTLTSVTPGMADLGSGNTTITLTGSGFVTTSSVQVNKARIPTTVVSPTTLTAVIPGADFDQAGTLQIRVYDPSIEQASAELPITVVAVPPQVALTGPSTSAPGQQPSLTFTIVKAYPVDLTVMLNLTFAPEVTPPVDDPAIVFSNGKRTYTFVVPANSAIPQLIALQTGTVAGTITVAGTLMAGDGDVTPAGFPPVVIDLPPAVPSITSATVARSGNLLKVVIEGFSNTREVSGAKFEFTPASGATIDHPDFILAVGPIFAAWYSSKPSDQYGSTFTYTQLFTVNDGAANVGSVQTTLTNSVGVSASQSAQ